MTRSKVICGGVCICGFCNVFVCICVGFVICGGVCEFCNMWECV